MADFYASLSESTPAPGLEPALVALWWAAKDSLDAEWERIVSALLGSGEA